MRRTLLALLCTGLAAAPFSASHAQNPQPAPPGQQAVPVAPPSAASPPPEKVAPGGLSTHSDKRTLSDKLAQQNGTLHPPSDVDPGMAVKSPNTTSTMPVVPPPGSKGGNQRVIPK